MTTEITPQDFIDGEYHKRVWKDCLIWYGDQIVEWVEAYKRTAGTLYALHADTGGDNTQFRSGIAPYELLRVEDISDLADVRTRLRALIEQIPDGDVVRAYVDMLGDVRWWQEYAARMKAKTP